jgi:fido (protein-threonine AMPylation protein)
MYEVEDDTYCYPGTTVLKNKLGLKSQGELDAFEAEITAQRASEPLPTGGLTYERYCAIHRHFFQDVYAWAGQRRTVRISKGGSAFCYPENIDREIEIQQRGRRQQELVMFQAHEAARAAKTASAATPPPPDTEADRRVDAIGQLRAAARQRGPRIRGL